MKELQEIVEQHLKNLRTSLPRSTVLIPENEISIYEGELTTICIATCTATVQKAFPALPLSFFDVLDDRVSANKFSNERLIDAVNYVIDHCQYPTPTIAEFISYDKRYRVYYYEDLVTLTNEQGPGIWANFKPITLPGREKLTWVHIEDVIKFNLKIDEKT